MNRYTFIALIACYINDKYEYCRVLLTLKMVAWNHYGALLARPVASYLICHDLHKKMSVSSFTCNTDFKANVLQDNHVLGQTTDSGSNNKTMAKEMELMFAATSKSVYWDSRRKHARCYCHKLALVVKAGLKVLCIDPGHTKPTTQSHTTVPIPTFQLNDTAMDPACESADLDEDGPLDEGDLGPELSDEESSGVD